MKTKIFIPNMLVLGVMSVLLWGCQKNMMTLTDEEENRSFMAVFRHQGNTGNANDPYASKVININDMYLTWNGIEGASGYHLKMKVQSGSWTIPGDILWDTIVGPDVLKIIKEDLQYSTKHNFAIQTLSSKGEAYNSKWYGLGDGSHNDDRAEWEMGERLGIPDVVSVGSVTETSMRVYFDLTVPTPVPADLNPSFQYENGKYIIDEILVQPASVNRDLPTTSIKLTDTDKANGYVDVTGLTSNSLYVVNGLNSKVPRYWDRLYNTSMVRMRGTVGEPILIPHIVDNLNPVAQQQNASRLDTILNNFLSDNTLAEGTIFMLEAGKKYYLASNVVLAKGLTLRTNIPGTKPIVYMGLGYSETNNANANAFNFQLGRPAQAGEIGSITMADVIFDDIDFQVPLAVNHFNQALFPGKSITGNYFINQHSASMPFTCSKLEARNCNFQGMVRSWFRTQGSNRQVIENIIVDKCLFHDCGMYDVNGRGYPFITGAAGSDRTNIFNNVVIKNNSFVGISWDQLVRETADRVWAPNVVWNVTIENNTFLNAFSITNARYLIQHRHPPANSTYTVKRNLFISVKASGDTRDFFQAGMEFLTYRNGLRFDIADNYSTSKTSANNTVTYFSSAEIINPNPFSSITRGAGYNGGTLNVGGLEATKVITGPTPIAPENLMVDPFPRGKKVNSIWDTNAHIYNVNGLKFKNTPEVQNHPIYTKNVGDPRWR